MAKKTNDELANLRALVRKRRSAVTAKENRIKKNTGVDIRGTEQDPRRPLNVVDKYNRRQLNTYLAELERFMSRSSGYVMGAGGVAIPKDIWNQYKQLEKQYNKIGASHFEKIADIFVPSAGMTLIQREKTLIPDTVAAQGEIINRPYSQIDRDSTSIKNPEALKTLIRNLKKKVHKDFLPEQLKAAREQLNQMLNTLGNSDLIAQANGFSDRQFDILWNYTNVATNASAIYSVMRLKAAGSEDRWYSTVVEDYASDIRELFDWASTLNRT